MPEQSVDFVGPNDDDSEPTFTRGSICFRRLPDGICLIVGESEQKEASLTLNERDLELLRLYLDQAMRKRPWLFASIGYATK